MRDYDFLSGDFFEIDIPKDKQYLLKYFKTERHVAFLRYYFVFGDWSCFKAHTGYHASNRFLRIQETRLHSLMNAYKQAKKSLNFDLLWLIESGKYRNRNY